MNGGGAGFWQDFLISLKGGTGTVCRCPWVNSEVIREEDVLPNRGPTLRSAKICVGPVDNELRGLTVLPGWIDLHVHILELRLTLLALKWSYPKR